MAELERVWEVTQARKFSLRPESLLAALVRTPKQFDLQVDAWKLSNKQRATGTYLVKHREEASEADLKYFQDQLVEKAGLDLVMELLRYCNRPSHLLEAVEAWPVPVLPLNGHDLMKAGVKGGPRVGVIKDAAKRAWMESGYHLEKEELLRLAMQEAQRLEAEAKGAEGGGAGGKEDGGKPKRRKVDTTP